MKVELIRTDGTHEWHEISRNGAIQSCCRLMGCELTDSVNLRDGRVMLMDDDGWETRTERPEGHIVLVPIRPKAGKQINPEATRIYRSVCKPGTTHQIVGDVIIVNDEDFA